jgi:hypothetical protein
LFNFQFEVLCVLGVLARNNTFGAVLKLNLSSQFKFSLATGNVYF